METRAITSDTIIPPGESLAEELEVRGLTPKEFAETMGVALRLVTRILLGQKPITAEFALKMERVLDVDPELWVSLEAHYQLALARKKEQEKRTA